MRYHPLVWRSVMKAVRMQPRYGGVLKDRIMTIKEEKTANEDDDGS